MGEWVSGERERGGGGAKDLPWPTVPSVSAMVSRQDIMKKKRKISMNSSSLITLSPFASKTCEPTQRK